jgi:hypothetical protein
MPLRTYELTARAAGYEQRLILLLAKGDLSLYWDEHSLSRLLNPFLFRLCLVVINAKAKDIITCG